LESHHGGNTAPTTTGGWTPLCHVRRFDHVGITVADLDAVTAFFIGLGLEVENRMFVEGEFLDTVIGIPGSRTEIVMLQPPDGGTRLELSSFARPDHLPGSPAAPANELGLRNVAFEVHDLQAAVNRAPADGYRLVGGIGEYEGLLADGLCPGSGRDYRLAGRAHRLSPEARPGRAAHGGLEAGPSSGISFSCSCLRRGVEKALHVCGPDATVARSCRDEAQDPTACRYDQHHQERWNRLRDLAADGPFPAKARLTASAARHETCSPPPDTTPGNGP
jgi:catechol 2,3-dioxygenase-like lactoylglutathione lyase family enzyme